MRLNSLIAFFVILTCSLGCGSVSIAQPCVPEDISFNSAGDYRIHRLKVQKSMDWLLRKPLHKKPEIRAELTAYSMIWLSGAPDKKVYLYSELLPGSEANPELMFVYAMALCRISDKHPDYSDVQLQTAALKRVGKIAKKSKGLVHDEALISFMTLYRSGNLNEWVTERFAGIN